MNKQMLTVFTILLLTLAITGYAYSTWTKSLIIQGTIHTAELSIYIDAYNNTKAQLSADKHTLIITDTITPGQTNWTGIIIKNNGTAPAKITYGITTDNPSVWGTYFTHNEYFYGPYTPNPPANVWNNAPTLPPAGGLSSPPETPAKNKLVAWQNITLSANCPSNAFTSIQITVAYTATFSSWTDTVYVIYNLTLQP